MFWIDTHCHLDAAEFDADRDAIFARAAAAGVHLCVMPAVAVAGFEGLRDLARSRRQPYALGIHPLYVAEAGDDDLETLEAELERSRDDPLLVAVGEIGIDRFAPGTDALSDRGRQMRFYLEQLRLARRFGLPAILHVRRSADELLGGLRRIGSPGGIAHAFNGSLEQAAAFTRLGFRLGFGGALTFERALRIRRLAAEVDATTPVLETDAPDIPPQWLYRDAGARSAGAHQGRNEPAELPRIAATLAALRGWSLAETAEHCRANAVAALPRLGALIEGSAAGSVAAPVAGQASAGSAEATRDASLSKPPGAIQSSRSPSGDGNAA